MPPTLLARERSFGGKAGIWFRKRKFGGANKTTKQLSRDIGPENPKPKGLSLSSHVIGWDEIRCRPIYKEPENTTATRSDENTDSKGYESPNTVVDNLEPDTNIKVKEKSAKSTNEPKNRTNKVRSYGRKRSSTSEEDEFLENLKPKKNSVNEKMKGNITTAIVSSTDETSMNAAKPRRVSTEFSECTSHHEDTTADEEDDSVFGFKNEDVHDKEIRECKTPQSRTVALSSTASLSAARAFFRQLDSEQLNLTQEPSTTPKRRRTVRTRRKASISIEQLSKEYRDYSAACEASQVSPLALEDYISNRGSYFRSMEMYDGFLDE